jgi:hypothetical protein
MRQIQIIIFFLGVLLNICPSRCLAQSIESGGILPPPVDITLTTQNIPAIGEAVTVVLRVTPLEDMHADIRCLLPEGVKPVMDPGLMVHLYEDRYLQSEQAFASYPPVQREVIGLWVGPLPAGETKELVFRVTITEAGTYEFTAVVEALAKWGIKEETLSININK